MQEDDKVTLAIIKTELDNLTKSVQELKTTFDSSIVTRNEWMLRNQYVDSKIKSTEIDVDELKRGRGPWWVWAMAVVAIISLGWNFIQPIVQAVINK